jgi:SAM-dependent MidA family methyltransferase
MKQSSASCDTGPVSLDLDPGLAALGNAPLVRAIIEEMDGGAIGFDRFMELALYHPEHGYYRKPGRVGTSGDFLTSPHVHPLFGWCIAAWGHWLWAELGRPGPFTIFEPGAGDGRLASSILDWVDGRDEEFRDALQYVALDPYGAAPPDSRITWVSQPPAGDCGMVLSNELFDALPVRLFEASARGPVEVLVRWDGERFEEVAGSVASIDGAPMEGRFEVRPGAYATMEAMAGVFARGAVLTFDYGYARQDLWAGWRTEGTLLCYYRHTAREDAYVHIGEQDMTAHVDFTELEAALAAHSHATYGPVSQGHFLEALGGRQLVEAVRSDIGEYFARRRALEQLTDAAGLGRIRVLAGLRGVEANAPPGFGEAP